MPLTIGSHILAVNQISMCLNHIITYTCNHNINIIYQCSEAKQARRICVVQQQYSSDKKGEICVICRTGFMDVEYIVAKQTMEEWYRKHPEAKQ